MLPRSRPTCYPPAHADATIERLSRQGGVTIDIDRSIAAYLERDYPDGSLAQRLIQFWLWLTEAGGCVIRDERGQTVRLYPNRIQRRIWLAMMGQAAAGKQVRLRIGKARKGGTSTFIQVLFSFLEWSTESQQAYCVSHREETRDALARMGKKAIQSLDPTFDPLATIHRYANGSWQVFVTSGGQAVGAGDTLSLLHWSERAKWGLKKDDTTADTAIAAQWADIIVDESTFKGRDSFWSDFDAARKGDGSYAALFVAWYEDDRCTLGECEAFEPDDEERGLVQAAGVEGLTLTFGQLAWRRKQIADLGRETFRQEYPSTPEEAIQAARGLIFPGSRGWIVDEVPFEYLSVPWELRVGGIDFGYNDPTVIWSGVQWDGVLYLIGAWRGIETLAGDQIEGLMLGHTYWCDPANLSDRKNLAKAASDADIKVTFHAAPRRSHKGEDTERSEIHRLIDFAAQGRLKVLRDVSDQLVAECDDLAWNEKTSKPEMRRSDECGHYDSIMALKYAVMGMLSKGEPKPPAPQQQRVTRRRSFARY